MPPLFLLVSSSERRGSPPSRPCLRLPAINPRRSLPLSAGQMPSPQPACARRGQGPFPQPAFTLAGVAAACPHPRSSNPRRRRRSLPSPSQQQPSPATACPHLRSSNRVYLHLFPIENSLFSISVENKHNRNLTPEKRFPMSSSAVRSWRTAFLTLRDENLASPPRATVVHLLDQLILSQSDSLITAAPQLPPHELTSDFMLLLELARNLSPSQRGIEDGTQTFIKLSQLIHGISRSSFLEMNSTLWTLVLDSFKRIVQIFLGKAKTEGAFIGNVAVIKPTKQCLESLRLLFGLYQASASLSENGQLLNFVLEVVDYFQRDSKHSTYFSDNYSVSGGVGEVLTIAFSMIGEIYSRLLPYNFVH